MIDVEDWLEVRKRRLITDQQKLRNLVENSDLIQLDELYGDPPEAYRVTYSCQGVLEPGDAQEPILGTHHEVEIQLPIEYPTKPPQLRWITKIYHPNINEEGTWVCIHLWYPGKFLDELCIMLGKMIQYRNYNPDHALRVDAALWSKSHSHLMPIDSRPLRKGDVVSQFDPDFEINIL